MHIRKAAIGTFLTLALVGIFNAQMSSTDPGVRSGRSVGGPLDGLTTGQLTAFTDGADDFNTAHSVDGSIRGADATGLGPVFNLDNCGGCHGFPAVGGTSPALNPQIAMATAAGANNTIPGFLALHGPIREVRFVSKRDGSPDGGVHALFTIEGRRDAHGCRLDQPDFDSEARRGNLAFRIPTPVFGDGLIENIPDAAILASKDANRNLKNQFGIDGHENRTGADGTITRFGWKAQNPSLAVFSGEAYNVEMGVTNELFSQERDQTPKCQFNPTPEDHPDFDAGEGTGVANFTNFMRFAAAPQPAPDNASIIAGRALFSSIGCNLCHTQTLKTGRSDFAPLSEKPVNLFSDLLVHDMGRGLEDRVSQGLASGREFRTAPLWGLGQRIFFLHDGRTSDLKAAIFAHRSQGSEASTTVDLFERLAVPLQQQVLNFLRSL